MSNCYATFFIVLLIVFVTTTMIKAIPATYDQRQDGDLNVKLDLDNFVILVARPVSAFDVFGSMSQLFAEAKKNSAESLTKESSQQQQQNNQEEEDQESKSIKEAIEKIIEKSAKEEEEETAAAIVAAALTENVDTASNFGAGEDDVIGTTKTIDTVTEEKSSSRNLNEDTTRVVAGKYKFVESIDEPQSLKLVGDPQALENCGPGRRRDSLGICQDDKISAK